MSADSGTSSQSCLDRPPKGAIKLVRDACCLTDADKLRAARTEAGGVKFDWENTREPGRKFSSREKDFSPATAAVGGREDQQVRLLFA